jgi:Sporulation and spore germination/L,D-transpeptidase catalytic domain/Putative peptidoglycan binding domain
LIRLFVAALVAAGAVLASATAAAAPPQQGRVFFLRGEQLAQVPRAGTSPAAALRQLIAGPTRAEHARGFRTYVPAKTKLLGVEVLNGIATVDFDSRFVAGRNPASRLARLSEVVRTLTGLQGTKAVQLLIDGKTVSGVFPGVPTERPVTFAFLQTPNVGPPKPPERKRGRVDPHVKKVQLRLIELGYLVAGDADGRLGPTTENAVLAFQKWERLGRTGVLDPPTEARLARALRPAPVTRASAGKRAEVLLDRQIALQILDNRVVRAISVSTGKPSTPTPPGRYRVYAKIPRWWSTPFREWLPWAVPFVGGIAFHEYAILPAYPASHGCVRQAISVAHSTYDFAEVGMPVTVLAKS